MRSCGQTQAASTAALTSHNTTRLVVPSSQHGHHHSSSPPPPIVQHSVRLPRSPPTSPRRREVLPTPADPELVHAFRCFLLKAAQRPAGVSIDLEQVLVNKLGAAVSRQDLDALLSSSSLADAAAAAAGTTSSSTASDSSSSSLGLPSQQLQELGSGLDHLLQVFSATEVFHLLQRQPALLFVPLASWCEFFSAYGFTPSQTKNLISQTHGEVLTKGSLVTAGDAIMHLKALGFDNDEIRHRVVAYCPQILAMSQGDIDILIRLWSKFKVGVDEGGPTC